MGERDTKKLGVIGGLGPIATAYFYELIIKMTDAKLDQQHIEMLIYSKPTIPDRTEYILGRSKDNPVFPMIKIGNCLAELGVDYIAIPCITAHYFHDILSKRIHVPIIHIIKETALHLKNHGIKCAGIMATEGTINSGLFQEELKSAGIKPLIPTKQKQDMVTDLIYKDIKANQPVEIHKFNEVSAGLKEDGAEVIILGCTELSLIKRDYDIGPGYIDAMEVLAMRSILLCEAELKDEYHSLITK
jgi:aspartate racemase